jgi:uncharacterized cupin superfamily protein
MNNVTIKTIDECDYYKGPNSIPGIRFRTAGRALGVTAWGMNILEIESGCTAYPEHDHAKDGQEEVYVILDGSATLVTGEGQAQLERGMLVRVAPGTKRNFIPGGNGVTILAIGSTPGQAYQARR